MFRIKTFLSAAVIALLFGFGVAWLTQPALSQGTALWPQVTTCAVSASSSAQCIGTNPTRRSIQICNVGTGTGGTTGQAVAIWIAPGSTTAAAGGLGSYPLAAVSNNVASCWTPPSGVAGSLGQSWNAIAVTSGGNLSIFEF